LKRLAACCALLVVLAAGAQAQERPTRRDGMGSGSGGGMRMRGYANPSAAIAAELEFARLARDKGQWTAFRAMAAPDAVMFAPAMVLAQPWLKDRANPPVPLAWQPHRVWSSCDGSLMVTTGAWQRADKHGWFTTVWQRQPDGAYKWVFDHGDATDAPIADPDMIAAKVADCPERAKRQPAAGAPPGRRSGEHKRSKPPAVPFDPAARQGRSEDGTLTWQVSADATGTHDFSARLLVDGQMQEFRKEHVAGG
jgi:hypothetical protein